MKKTKLKVYVLERREIWNGSQRWVLANQSGAIVADCGGANRRESERLSASMLMNFFGVFGQNSELQIRNTNGTFSPARTYPRSADPKRSKG